MGKDLNLIDLSKLKLNSKEYNKANRHNTALRAGFKDYNQHNRYIRHINKNSKSNKEEFLALEKNKKNKLEEMNLIDISQFDCKSTEYNRVVNHNSAIKKGFSGYPEYRRYKKYIAKNPEVTIGGVFKNIKGNINP